MRRTFKRLHHTRSRSRFRWLCIAVAALLGCLLAFDVYVEYKIKPTLLDLAEYQARAMTMQTIQSAVYTAMAQTPEPYADLYRRTEDALALDGTRANLARGMLLQAVDEAMQALPCASCEVPFGSLTGHTLLSGLGPAWRIKLQPQGFAQGTLLEQAEAIGINAMRCRLTLRIEMVVNMILDGRTKLMAVRCDVPLAAVLVQGETPAVYAQD